MLISAKHILFSSDVSYLTGPSAESCCGMEIELLMLCQFVITDPHHH